MFKKIIFDIDGTLLDSTKDALEAYKKFLLERPESKINQYSIYNTIDEYEAIGKITDKKSFVNFINEQLNIDMTMDDFNFLLEKYHNEATLINENTENILKYLSEKYELVVLSNWYIDGQKNRLAKVEIDKYFKEFYGIDNLGPKPLMEVYQKACHPYQLHECLIIGDNKIFDVKIPLEIGMGALHLNLKPIKSEYPSINSLDELKDIL